MILWLPTHVINLVINDNSLEILYLKRSILNAMNECLTTPQLKECCLIHTFGIKEKAKRKYCQKEDLI